MDTKEEKLSLQSTIPFEQGAVEGLRIPLHGFGVYKASDGKECEQAVTWALKAGYRHIDTAAIYGNEASVGRAIRASGVPREQIFVTTKLWNADQGYESTLKAFDKSLELLGLDYVDCYLMHYPVAGKRLDTWRAMEKIFKDGRARSIGVSNFTVPHLKQLLENCTMRPCMNQIEISPYFVRKELVDFCRSEKIVVEAYSPLTKGKKLNDPPLVAIASKYGKSTAQLLIRYCLQRGIVTLVKSSNEERIKQNVNVYDFEISAEDMEALNKLDCDLVTGWDSRAEP